MKPFKKCLLKTSIVLLAISYALILFFSIWALLYPISHIILGIIISSQLVFIVLTLEYTKKWFKHVKEWHKLN